MFAKKVYAALGLKTVGLFTWKERALKRRAGLPGGQGCTPPFSQDVQLSSPDKVPHFLGPVPGELKEVTVLC